MKQYPILSFLAGLMLFLLLNGCTQATPPPIPTPRPPTAEPPSPLPPATETPAQVSMWCDVWLNVEGPAGDLASRNPSVGFEAEVQGANAVQVVVESPSGKKFILPPYSDIPYGRTQRFGSVGGPGLPEIGRTYTCTAVAADGTPIPGAVAYDTYIGGQEPDPPTGARAEVVAGGVQVTWQPSPAIPGKFDPGASPRVGYYVVFLFSPQGELEYGWNGGSALPEPAHLIPLHRQDFGKEDAGVALEALGDGVYRVEVIARSVAPAGSAGQRDECWSKDSAQNIRLVIEKGQVRVEAPTQYIISGGTDPAAGIFVDDFLRVFVNKNQVAEVHQGGRCCAPVPPIRFAANPGDLAQVQALDANNCYSLEAVWFQKADGSHLTQLTGNIAGPNCGSEPPGQIFFDKSFTLP